MKTYVWSSIYQSFCINSAQINRSLHGYINLWSICVYLTRSFVKLKVESSLNISGSIAEPGRPLPGSLHYPLVLVLLAWLLTLIQHDRLHSRGPQRASFSCLNLLTNQTSLLADLCITETAQDMFLLQVATLCTHLNVGLREGDTERDSEHIETAVEEALAISGIFSPLFQIQTYIKTSQNIYSLTDSSLCSKSNCASL